MMAPLGELFALFGAVRSNGTSRVLDHPLRARIHDAIQHSPGILPQAVATKLGCNRSTVRYHLARLQTAGLIRVISSDKRAHLFLATMKAQEQDALSVLQRGRTWDLARQVARLPGQPQCDLTQDLHMSRKLLRKYVDRLLQVGLIEEVEDPPYLTYFPTPSLHEVIDSVGHVATPDGQVLMQASASTGPAEPASLK